MAIFRIFLARLLLGAVGLCLSVPLHVSARPQPPIVLLSKANALPLAIDPAFQIRKVKTYFLESLQATGIRTNNTEGQESISFERRHLLYGAITGADTRDRYGDYYTFFWRATRPANLTLRLEYRQQKTGGLVQAREVNYPDARGSYVTQLSVNGDDYLEQGRVSAWRVLLIQNHQTVVAFRQSYLWR